MVRRGFNSQERLECEGQTIPGEGTSGVDVGEADAAASAEAAASAAGNKGGRGKKRGKRSRHGHKEEAQREKTQVGVKTNRCTWIDLNLHGTEMR